MFQALFDIIINLLGTLIQIVVLPINLIITNTIPDLSSYIDSIIIFFSTIFNNLAYPLSILPPNLITILSLIVLIEICKHTIYLATHSVIKIWNLFQKIKFW